MNETLGLMKELVSEIENGNLYKTSQLRTLLIDEGLYSQKLIDDAMMKGESNYLRNTAREEGKNAIFIGSYIHDELKNIMKTTINHFGHVLGTKPIHYKSTINIDELVTDLCRSYDNDSPFIGYHIGKTVSFLVSRGKMLYGYSELDIDRDDNYGQLMFVADPLNVGRVSNLAKANRNIKTFDKYDDEECRDLPNICYLHPFKEFIKSSDNIRV
jgi:hypothetical protein